MPEFFQFPEICITEASAGSGKTYALAKRYVQLLLQTARDNPQSYKNILAITFTNKASLEMKSRVLVFLKKIALKNLNAQEEEQFLKPLDLTPAQGAELAFGLMESIIHHYHFFAVKTIDSFINALLAGCAFKINLSARFKIQRNSADYLEQSLDQWIALSHQNAQIRKLLDDFVHQYLFLENRSGWFPKEDLLEVLKILFSEYNTYQKSFITFPAESRDLYLAKKEFLELAKTISTLADVSMNKAFLGKLSEFLEEHPVSFDLDKVSKYFARPEFPANKGVEVSPELEKVWGQAYDSVSKLCLAESYGVFNPYVQIFQNVGDLFANLCAQQDILFLEELNKKAAALIGEGMSVHELYYRLASRFRHYLMDEFQDTSLSQCQNLLPMLQEALSTGGSLFLVGDKKQAIYSFRGGESGLFEQLPARLGNAPIRREFLTQNWRSQKAIVEFNNRLFSPENLGEMLNRREEHNAKKNAKDEIFFNEQDLEDINTVFGHAHQEVQPDKKDGFVEVLHIEGKRKQDREELIRLRLLQTIEDVRTRFHLKDIAILTRNNGQVEQVTQWLLTHGIYAQSDRTSDIKNHPMVLELVDFLKFLNTPSDNVSFARFLLGDIFPKVSGIAKQEIQDFLFECRKARNVQSPQALYKEFSAKYPDIWQKHFEGFFKQVGIYPVYELMVSVYDAFRLHEFKESQGFFMHFLELIKRQEEYSCDIETFIAYFDALNNEERFVPMPAQDAVKVMTIHKAKGLEFNAVILPFLEMTIQTTKGSQGTMSYVLDTSEEGLRMLRLKKTYGHFNELLKSRYEQEYKDSFKSELNSVYVALTRAVWEMYVMVPERTGNSINPVRFLIPDTVNSVGEKKKVAFTEEAAAVIPALKARFDRQWVGQLKEDFPLEDREGASQRLQGTIMHYALSLILRVEFSAVVNAVRGALAKTKERFGHMVNEVFCEEALLQFLKRPDVSRYFDVPAEAQIFCEQEVVNRFGDSKRIDRLIVFKDKVWIVDFKTSRAQEALQKEQLEEYKKLVQVLYPKHKVEGFLVYLT